MPRTKKTTTVVAIKKKPVKKIAVKAVKEETSIEKSKGEKYFEAIGRRKTAVARTRLFTKGDKDFIVNNKPLAEYFPSVELQETCKASLSMIKSLDKFRILNVVKGGGICAQAEAIRFAIARALVSINPNFRKKLKRAGFLKRDSRMKERKKFGLKRARKAPQWAKR